MKFVKVALLVLCGLLVFTAQSHALSITPSTGELGVTRWEGPPGPDMDAIETHISGIMDFYGTGLPAGPLDVAAVVGMLPMDYELVVARLTGAQLLENVECCGPQAGGLREADGRLWLAEGTPVEPGRTDRVLTSEFLYTGGEGFRMRAYDPAAERTGLSWRQPVIDWIRARRSTRQTPLDDHLDPAPWRG